MNNQEINELLELAYTAIKVNKYDEGNKLAQHIIETIGSDNELNINYGLEADNSKLVFLSRSHRLISESLWRQGKVKEALPHAYDALNVLKGINNSVEEASVLKNIGVVYARLSQYNISLDYLNKSLQIFEQISQKECIAPILGNIGNIYQHLSDYPLALEYMQKALAMYRELGILEGISMSLTNIGNVYISLSKYQEALEYLQTSLDIDNELGLKADASINLTNIGKVYGIISDFPRALVYFQKALKLCEDLSIKDGIALNLGNIGLVYWSLSDNLNALNFFNKALDIYTELDAKEYIARNLGNIGNVFQEISDLPNALKYYQMSLEIFVELGIKESIALNMGNLGNLYSKQCNFDQALKYYQNALQIYKELNSKDGIARNLGHIGVLYSDNNYECYNVVKAEKFLQESVALYNEIGVKLYLYQANRTLANLYKQQKRWEEYSEHIEKYHELYIEVQNEEVKKQADKFGWERKIADMEKQKEIEAIKTDADKRLLEETISFQKQSIEQQSREVKNTVDELVRKNSLLQLIQSDLKKIAPHTKREGTDYIDQLLERVTRNITPLESNQQLDKQLAEVHVEFTSNLRQKFPDLTTMELKIAALLSMKLTSSNIAAALFLAKRTVESHRFSLRKKMGLGTSDDIYRELAKYSA